MAAGRVKQLCVPRASVFQTGTKDTVDSLSDLMAGKIVAADFFKENHFTEGMRQLCAEGLKRLDGRFDTGVFRLKQAMGGGKTHSLIAFGLLASDPAVRAAELPGQNIDPCRGFGKARIVTFEGRESPVNGLWGHIAKALGKEADFARFYSPLQAPGKEDWANLIGQEPIVLMFDELPPYLQGAAGVPIGQTNLAMITSVALANLLMAVQEKLPKAVVVITDLNSSWEGGSLTLDSAIKSAGVLSDEISRSAVNIEPVRLNSGEIYDILRKRVFERIGSSPATAASEIAAVEDEFRSAFEKAEKTGFAASAAFGFASEIASSYPFHPKIKELFARFKENEGFQQTRGIVRMVRALVAALWNDGRSDPWLIAPACANLNDHEVFGEFKRANPSIETAVMSDVANGGASVAEKAGPVAEEVARTILMASLARGASQARLGLSVNEIESILVEPGRSNAEIKAAVERIRLDSLYLHMGSAGDLFYRENKNLTAAIRDEAAKCRPEDVEKELKRRLSEIFQVRGDSVHQDLLVFPDRSEIVSRVSWERVALAIVRQDEWDGRSIGELPESLQEVFDKGLSSSNRNRLALLSLGKDELSIAERNIRELWAIGRVLKQRLAQGVAESDPEMQEAKKREAAVSANVVQSVLACPSHLHYPDGEICARPVEKSSFVKSAASGANGAALIEETLVKAEKLPKRGWEAGSDFQALLRRFQGKVFTSAQTGRTELARSAADNAHWIWTRPGEFERFVARAVKEDLWREQGGLLLKKPKEGWPAPEPEVDVLDLDPTRQERQSGVDRVTVSPRNADRVRWAAEGSADASSPEWSEGTALPCLWATFLAEDSVSGKKAKKLALRFNPQATVRGDFRSEPGAVVMTLQSVPSAAPSSKAPAIFYTTDGSSPTNEAARKAYQGPVQLPAGCSLVLAFAVVEATFRDVDGSVKTVARETQVVRFEVPSSQSSASGSSGGAPARKVDASKPARWVGGRDKSFDDAGKAFRLISLLAEKQALGRGGLLQFKTATGIGAINFGSDQQIKPESLSKLADLLQTEFAAEIQRLRINEIDFAKGSDLNDLSKALDIDVEDKDWEQQ